jgi:uncharacterized repeat protein (TIGR01451 family)
MTALVGLVLATGGLLALDVAAAGAASITSAGPLTQVGVSTDTTLDCSANHTGDTSGEFYNGTSCGTWTVVDGTLYGPDLQATGLATTQYTPVSQTGPTGTGTTADPFKIVTVADAGTTGIRLTQTDTYTTGLESFNTDVAVSNTSTSSHTLRVYRAADCFLQNDDQGFGALDTGTGAVACTTGLEAGARIEQWFPVTAGSHALEAGYSDVYAAIAGNQPFDDTCVCTTKVDNGAGLSWDATLAASTSKTFSSLITFSPLGVQPLSLTITPDATSVASGGTAGYTIKVHNPNTGPVTLSSLSDVIPATFTYVTGSTTGLTSANPTIGSGNTLTWNGSLVVPGSGDGLLHFSATVGTTTGSFTSSATGIASGGYTVVDSGPEGAVMVTGVTSSLQLALTPVTTSQPANSSFTFTATATDASTPKPGLSVTFTVLSGPNQGLIGRGTTDVNGRASFTLSPRAVGTDVVRASVLDGGTTVESNTGSVTWTQVRSGLSLAGTSSPSEVTAGALAQVTFTLTNTGNAPIGVLSGIVVPTGSTPVSLTPSIGACTPFGNGGALCLGGPVAPGASLVLTAVVRSAAGSTGPFVSSFGALATGDLPGFEHAQSGSITASSTVVAATPDTATGFVPPGGSISTGTSPTAANNTVATFTLPNTGSGAPITLRAEPANSDPVCGGQPCLGRPLFLSPFAGYTNTRHPAILKIVYDVTTGVRLDSTVYVQKEDGGAYVPVANCRDTAIHLADPHPCVHERTKRSSGDIEFEILLISGDPRFRTR